MSLGIQASLLLVGLLGLILANADSALGAEGPDQSSVDFQRDIRPILSNHCFECHGPDEQQREADLRLDERAGAIADLGGRRAIVTGQSDASELINRVTADDDDERMPPVDHGEPLTEQQITLLRRWIDQGAEFPKHWSFRPIQQPAIPKVDGMPKEWSVNPIDAFIYRKLAQRAIAPAEQADRGTLIRRVSLDLLGIPPTIAQVERFQQDRQVGAVERMIDRTLRSQRFGERWGRHWLDQARYADSHGYTNDNARSMWPYRDWVIKAFNEDMPFDKFTIEQLAGDLMPGAMRSQKVATGFHRNTLINSEGGTKADQFRDEQVKDRVDTTGVVWMGMTVGCAKCHSHKFDPLSQSEYYSLYAFFNSTVDANSVTPIVKVPSSEQQIELAELDKRRQRLEAQIESDPGRSDRQSAWEAEILASAPEGKKREEIVAWEVLDLSGKSDLGATFTSLDDKSLVVSGEGSSEEEYQALSRSPLTTIRSVRVEVLTDESLPESGPGRASDGNFLLSEFWFRTGDGRELRFSKAAAEHSQDGHEIAKAIDGKGDTGWSIDGAPEGDLNRDRTAWFVLPEPLTVELHHGLTFKMQFKGADDHGIGRYRISISQEEWIERPDPTAIATLLRVPRDDRSDQQQAKIEQAFVQMDPRLSEINDELIQVIRRLEAIEREIPTTMVMEELEKPRQAHLQVRGDFLRPGDAVQPTVPSVLPPLDSPDDPNRLTFARWLVRAEHPLTARVRVNRIWMRLFGRGLVETENDFGIQGSLPSHPELLDWLAAEFMRLGWSHKKLVRLIMASATYRQSSHHRDDLKEVDPQNRLLARQSRLRVEAEIVRDLALCVSGKLSKTIGGPSVYPPQPKGVYAFTQRKKEWKTSEGDDRFRRGMYTFFYRSAPYPMLSTFDVPKFNTVCTSRDRSNTPLQSLTMANSASLLELAGYLGQRILGEKPKASDDQRIAHAYQLCFSRMPTTAETSRIQAYLADSLARFDDEEKAWTAVARVLINLDEFITRE